jgi:hypothetical protein
MKVQNRIQIVLTKHQELKRYKITIFNTLQCNFQKNKNGRVFTLLKASMIESVLKVIVIYASIYKIKEC